jgi:hypothetical protein
VAPAPVVQPQVAPAVDWQAKYNEANDKATRLAGFQGVVTKLAQAGVWDPVKALADQGPEVAKNWFAERDRLTQQERFYKELGLDDPQRARDASELIRLASAPSPQGQPQYQQPVQQQHPQGLTPDQLDKWYEGKRQQEDTASAMDTVSTKVWSAMGIAEPSVSQIRAARAFIEADLQDITKGAYPPSPDDIAAAGQRYAQDVLGVVRASGASLLNTPTPTVPPTANGRGPGAMQPPKTPTQMTREERHQRAAEVAQQTLTQTGVPEQAEQFKDRLHRWG